jgi:antitoxin HicB
MQFPARFKREPGSGAFNVSFPDIPEALTFGITEQEAIHHALDALETALDFYFEDGRPIPVPSLRKRGQRFIVATKCCWYRSSAQRNAASEGAPD